MVRDFYTVSIRRSGKAYGRYKNSPSGRWGVDSSSVLKINKVCLSQNPGNISLLVNDVLYVDSFIFF